MPATLDEMRPTQTIRRPDGEFVDLGYRAVFKEHQNRLGTKFSRESMEKIARRCNERIETTGDYSPIVIGHTKDDASIDPRVVGFCGPYKAARMQDGTWAVYGKMRIFKEDEGDFKRHPRVSVEYWSNSEEPDGGWFDPISLLGATTPELDLGIHYCKRGDENLMRYSAEIGGANTFVPGGIEKKDRYQDGSLSGGDLQQIIAAMQPIIVESVKAAVGQLIPVGGTTRDINPMNALDDTGGGMGDELGGELGAPGDEEDEEGDGLGLPEEDDTELTDELPEDIEGEETPAEGDDPAAEKPAKKAKKDKPAKFAKACDSTHYDKLCQYEADGDMTGADQYFKDLDNDSKDGVRQRIAGDQDEPRRKSMSRHCPSDKGTRYMATANDQETLARYEKEVTGYKKQVADLTTERDDFKTKYEKEVNSRRNAETDLTDLKQRMTKIEASEQKAIFYQKTAELQSVGVVLDQDKEWDRCKDFTPDVRLGHIDVMREYYQKIPLTGINSKPLPMPATSRIEQDEIKAAEKRTRYSKQAMDNVLAARCKGDNSLDYKVEYERILREDPETKKTAA